VPEESTLAPEAQPEAQQPLRFIDKTLRVINDGPRVFFRAAMISLAVSSVAAIAIAFSVRRAGTLHGPQRDIVTTALVVLCVVVVASLAAIWRRGHLWLDRLIRPEQRSVIWLALAVWAPFLLLVAYYAARATLPPSQQWIAFGYDDKRWETAAYLLAALAPMLLLVAAARVLEVARSRPATWRSWFTGLVPRRAGPKASPGSTGVSAEPASAASASAEVQTTDEEAAALAADRRRWFRVPGFIRIPAGVVTALGLAYYFCGPPWYLNKSAGAVGIGFQEDVFLGGMQAISRGGVPYIGPAAEQYGPGAQYLSYLYMRHISTFSLVGFRESWAAFEWIGASILFVILFLALGYVRGLLAVLLTALVYPGLQNIGFLPGQSYTGFFGWASPLRYVGAIGLILLLPAAIKRCPRWPGLLGAGVLGLMWGAMCYMAQENLLAGVVGMLAIAVLLLLSGTSTWRSVWSALVSVVIGALVAWAPVLYFYTHRGLLGRFVYLYFLLPRAVAEGYSNSPYGGTKLGTNEMALSDPWRLLFYSIPIVLAIVAILAVVQFRPFRIARDWSSQRIMFVAVTVTTILLYQGALLRSDESHLMGTLLIFPAFEVMAVTVLPRLAGVRRIWIMIPAGIALAAAAALLLPLSAVKPAKIGSWAEAPYLDRNRLAADPSGPVPAADKVAELRLGTGLIGAPHCCQRSYWSMLKFAEFMGGIHKIVGNRTAYIEGFPNGYPGIVYFVADLKPAQTPLDLDTMVLTEQQMTAYQHTFRTSVLPHVQALLTFRLGAPETVAFLQRYPHAREIRLWYEGKPYWVILRDQ
jgi:hypothetical protein